MRSFITLSHPYKGMRERTTRQAEGKTTLLGVGWFFPHCRWAGSPGQTSHQGKMKSPEGLLPLRAVTPIPLVSPMVTGTARATTVFLPNPAAIVVALVMSPAWMRREIGDPIHRWRIWRADHHGRGIHRRHPIHHGRWQTRWRWGHHHGRCEYHWQAEVDADLHAARPGGESHGDQCDCCDCDHHFRFHTPVRRWADEKLRRWAID